MQGYLQFQMRYLSEIFWRHSQDVSTLVPNNSEFLLCLSVRLLAYFLPEIRLIQGNLKFWMRYLSEIFWRLSWNVCTLHPNNFEFLVCLSVFQLAYYLTEIRLLQVYLQFLRYLSELFWRLSWNVFTMKSNISEFLVFLSVCQLVYFLTEIISIQICLQFWMRYFSEILWRNSQDIFGLFSNPSVFLVCLSVCKLAHFLTKIMLIQGHLQSWMKYISEFFWRLSLKVCTLD